MIFYVGGFYGHSRVFGYNVTNQITLRLKKTIKNKTKNYKVNMKYVNRTGSD